MPKKNEDPMTECDSCGQRLRVSEVNWPLARVSNLGMRLDPGGEVPAGECACGSLVYLTRSKKKLKVVVEVGSPKCPDEVTVTIKDHDNDLNG